ncbi:P-loop containing nucleoside triphosphate hydrolase protein [Mucor lusitanicus]|uniref:Uncharacterized protein n=2 Tax=Mucor circinelloides f. lusitanicus TaxID=29924 RepID=A0A168NVP8_MUCCL|nr:P-loop containing nucleoside triphosphate hydrolase protein [Mucor lusitanicus]OAD06805.1 hypothetical protein MUCCIDRAFT_160432 [Mucor lusitanicus CBS 277.49]
MPKRTKSTTDQQAASSSSKRVKTSCLQELQSKFERLNVFCAFCDARLTTSITLQGLQKAVSDLTVEDLASINAIVPNFVKFNHVSSDVLEIEFGRPASKKQSKQKHAQAIGNRGDDWFLRGFSKNRDQGTPKPVKPDAVKKLIEQQNKMFDKALAKFIKHCDDKKLDVDQHLLYEREKHIPIPYLGEEDPFEEIDTGLMPDSSQPKTMPELIQGMKSQYFYGGQLEDEAHTMRTFDAKLPQYDTVELSGPIKAALQDKGIHQLYVHQTEAIKGLAEGHHVIVSTSTASGKSLIYQVPVLEDLLTDKSSKAMYIFPTKALAQDQMRALKDIIQQIPDLEDVVVSTFDGDTPSDARSYIRRYASVIFTNPDMLHHAVLPNAKLWRHFLAKLKYVVVDELHVYNGLFGTHVALIMRRLRRLCHLAGNNHVQFISCSATIASPDKHMKAIFGIDNVKLIDVDGAPHGKKEFIVWNPSLHTPLDEHSERRGAIAEGADILEYLLENNVRTIAFCKVRKSCELLMKQLRENLQRKQRKDIMNKVMSYRGGYTAENRRKIESQMFSGELLGIIATNALELGVDIGSLDAVLMIGVPWSISALWQQSGRSGRRNADSLSLVVCDGNPLDQHYARHPEELFVKLPDTLSINFENSIVIESHVQCAAEEEPIHAIQDQVYFGENLPAVCEEHLTPIGDQLYRPDPKFRPYPSQYVNIRNINQDSFAVVDVTDGRNVVLEEIEVHRVGFEIYEGAIFIHQGRTYLVEECNIDKKYSKVHLARVDWTTVQRDYTNVDAHSTDTIKHILDTRNTVSFGKVTVSTVVFGYYRIDRRKRIIDTHDVYMDPIIVESTGVWADAPGAALKQLDFLNIDPMAAIHAASHCLISLLPRFAYSAIADLRTECKNPSASRQRPARIALYETQPSGVVRQAFKFFDGLVNTCINQIEACTCDSGCPSCVHLAFCSEQNQVCSKEGALIVLKALRGDDVLTTAYTETEIEHLIENN